MGHGYSRKLNSRKSKLKEAVECLKFVTWCFVTSNTQDFKGKAWMSVCQVPKVPLGACSSQRIPALLPFPFSGQCALWEQQVVVQDLSYCDAVHEGDQAGSQAPTSTFLHSNLHIDPGLTQCWKRVLYFLKDEVHIRLSISRCQTERVPRRML